MPSKAIRQAGSRAVESTQRAASTVSTAAAVAEDKAEKRVDGMFSDSRMGRVAQEGTLMTLLVLGILGSIGILIYSEVSTSLPEPTDPDLQNASSDVDGGFADAMQLLPIVLIVLMAGLVIAVVQRFRG